MLTNPSPVIVKEGDCAYCASVHVKQLHHRNFPEIWAEAGSVAEGLTYLTNQLSRARDGVGDGWHRESIERAMTDVAEFREALAEAESDGKASCRCGARGPGELAASLPNLSLCR